MLYERRSSRPVAELISRIEEAAAANQFGVLNIIDLKAKMAEKGVALDGACVILEICNPALARTVLSRNPAVSTSLPCRVSVYLNDGQVTVGTVKPTVLISSYPNGDDLVEIAREVEYALIRIINTACDAREDSGA
jgi:uncharacterized protein (DUF302 family)